ncbi:unnamed protein product [Echinostoma caproni]|uniref:Endo/exonuclease/phosphatase domain-containing protein n=1 Tax=Echinostoma caproni TaxID=27848 RepID=A0A183AJY8_9TREM|nr:unnamed protein product [Echinostoma caproni]
MVNKISSTGIFGSSGGVHIYEGALLQYLKEGRANGCRRPEQDPDGQGEALWCKTKLRGSGYKTIRVPYRRPATDPATILDDMRRQANDSNHLILGDFNVLLIDWDENRCLLGAG